MRISRRPQLLFSVVSCVLAAGPIFGFPALKRVLVREGVYSQFCRIEEIRQGIAVCAKQELRFNRMFTVAVSVSSMEVFLVQWLTTRYSPRLCGIISALMMAAGIFLLSRAGIGAPDYEHFSTNVAPSSYVADTIHASNLSRHSFDWHLWGYLLLACSGPLVYVGALSTAVSSASTLAVLTAALDASAIVFPIYRVINAKYDLTSAKFFSYYMLVPLLLLLGYIILKPEEAVHRRYRGMRPSLRSTTSSAEWNRRSDSTELNNNYHDEGTSQNNETVENTGSTYSDFPENNSDNSSESHEDNDGDSQDTNTWNTSSYETTMRHPLKDTSGLWGVMHDASFSRQLGSTWFILVLIFAGLAVIRINFFISTIWRQYAYLLGSWDTAAQVSSALEYALPIGGIVVSPLVGVMLDRISTFKSFAALCTLSLITGLLNDISSYPVAIINILFFVIYRPFLLTAISDYTVRVFGLEHFNAIYGWMWLLIGLFNFSQINLDSYYVWNLENDPFWFNIYLTILTAIVGFSLVAYIFFQGKRIRRKQLEDEALSAPIEPMPGSADYFP